jgi:hypothetical protein
VKLIVVPPSAKAPPLTAAVGLTIFTLVRVKTEPYEVNPR